MAATQAALDQGAKEILAQVLLVDEEELTPGARLVDDLNMDSLDRIEIALEIEEKLLAGDALDDAEAEAWQTVADVLATVRKAARK